MASRFFIDTNILVYAHDTGSGARHEKARALLKELWANREGVLSTQVIQEFYINVRRKARNPVSAEEARQLVEDYLCWEVVVNDGKAILGALELELRYQLSFWDALIVHAANLAGSEALYSEDLNHGQVYGGVRVINPLSESS